MCDKNSFLYIDGTPVAITPYNGGDSIEYGNKQVKLSFLVKCSGLKPEMNTPAKCSLCEKEIRQGNLDGVVHLSADAIMEKIEGGKPTYDLSNISLICGGCINKIISEKIKETEK